MKKKVLILIHHFLPGEKAGGPVSSIKNLCQVFNTVYDFYIVCLNHDIDGTVYDIETGVWVSYDYGFVMYLSDSEYTKSKILELCNDFEIVYSCGLFEKSSFWAATCFKNTSKRICIAPMGSLYPSALSQKSFKKKVFISWTKIKRIYKNVVWSASSNEECEQIKKFYGNEANIIVATDPIVYTPLAIHRTFSEIGKVKIAFISRINRVKNLDFALNILRLLPNNIYVSFDIYGFDEDDAYLNECLAIINTMPKNISCKYLGGLNHDEVKTKLSNYDCLLLPTKGENFGHVIYESLSVGVFPIISNTTIWNFLDDIGCAKCLSLNDKVLFKNAIIEHANLTCSEKREISDKCICEAKKYFDYQTFNSGFLRMFKNGE